MERRLKAAVITTILFGLCSAASATDVVTQHNDALRTGWNPSETVLTASNVKTGSFGLQHSVALDDQVDAQPLVLANETIGGASRTVAYVVTENNTVYAIDAASGAVLLKHNLGTPVPEAVFGNCNNNAIHVGIGSTPVIDRAAGKLYVVTNTLLNSTTAVYKLHALGLTTLSDTTTPVTIAATHKLANGTIYTFQANHMRQRAALLEAGGNIYVAFTSYCDLGASTVRGFVLGYKASSLAPLAANYLSNTLATGNFFLSTIWMSGNGLAASSAGNILLVTGNSKNGTYNSATNLEESVVALSSDLTHVLDFFTPSNVNTMSDQDLNSGGILLIPPQAGTATKLATALGKDGRLFLLDQQNLGKFSTSGNHVLGTFSASQCWCAASYYTGPSGQGRVVTSSGNRVIIWAIQTSPKVSLSKYETMPAIATGQDPGFFTSVSANGHQTGTIIVWAVSRPTSASPASVLLYAFDVANGSLLYSAVAGTWPNVTGNANIVPTVVNGQALVASFKQLAIFGPGAALAGASPAELAAGAPTATSIAGAPNQVTGWIDQINGNQLTIRKRDGTHMQIDATAAISMDQSAPTFMGESITAFGTVDSSGTLQAVTIIRAKDAPALWPPDL